MIDSEAIECVGCGMCAVVCSKNSLKIEMNKSGFYTTRKIHDNCNNCGLCKEVCPMYGENISLSHPQCCFSAYSLNDETRKTCSSGGVGHEIANLLLSKGWEVCGVIYDAKCNRAAHTVCKSEDDLERVKGSKYLQSYTVQAFNEVANGLKQNRKYVVFGTPCQIAAFDKYSRILRRRTNLLLIDFFCHGVPSYLLWESYLGELTKRHRGTIRNVRFRDKRNGWHAFTMAIEYDDSTYYSDRHLDKDMFYEFFLGNYCLNDSCYNSIYRYLNSKADIRLGDLWGRKFESNREGVSGMIVFTNAGMDILDTLRESCRISAETMETVTEGQIKGDLVIPSVKNYIINDLQKKHSLAYIYNKRIIPIKIKRKINMIRDRWIGGAK